MRSTGSELDEYLRTQLAGRAVPLLKSERPYLDLLRRGILKPGMLIRVHDYGRIQDPHYEITERGFLVDALCEGRPMPARQVLSEDAAPDGWEIASDLPSTYHRSGTG